MNISPKKVVAILIPLAAILIAGYLYFAKRERSRDPEGRVANLSYYKNQVESRYAGEIQWRGSLENENLFEDDAVKTHASALALVTFLDSATIRIDENSVVIIRAMEKNTLAGNVPIFEVVNGRILAYSKTKFKIATPKGTSTILPEDGEGKVAVEVDEDGTTRISLFSGKAIASLGSQALEILKGFGIEIRDKIPDNATRLLDAPQIMEPADGAKFTYSGTDYPKVAFRFEKRPLKYHLQIAEDLSFSRVVSESYSAESEMTVDKLGKGEYWWNVALVDENRLHGNFSQARKLTVEPIEAPSAAKESPAVSEAPPPVPHDASMKVSGLQGKPQIVRSGASQEAVRSAKVLKSDEIKVPIKSHLALSFENEGLIEVRENSSSTIDSIVERGRGGDREIVGYLKEGAMLLNLSKIKGSNVSYTLRTASSKVTVTTKKMKGKLSQIFVEKRPDGSVRLISLMGTATVEIGGVESQLAPGSSILIPKEEGAQPRIEEAPRSPISLERASTVRIFYDFELPLITYSWPERPSRFLFELSGNKNFKPVVLSEFSQSNYFTLLSPKEGRYFWRYKDASGKSSKAGELVVVRSQELSLETLKVVVYENEPTRIIWFDQKPPVIMLAWEKVTGAGTCEVEIFKDEQLATRIFTKSVTDDKLSFLADFFQEGDYFWRVKSYSPAGTLLHTGKVKSFSLRLNLASPTLKIDLPINNSIYRTPEMTTKGQMYKKANLSINGVTVEEQYEGPFDHKAKLASGRNQIIYKEEGADGTVSYYLRHVTFK